jgi:hypothetical protein
MAKVCHICGRHQNTLLNQLQHAATFTTILMAVIAMAQVYVSYYQMVDTKAKHVEAEEVLKQSQAVLAKATNDSESVKKISMDVLSKSATESENTIKNANNVLLESRKTSYKAIMASNNARKDVANTVKSINTQLSESNKRIIAAETGFIEKFDKTNRSIEKVKSDVSTELGVLKKRNELVLLADKAISTGDRKSFERLEELSSSCSIDSTEALQARSESLRVRVHYVSGTSLKNIYMKRTDGTVVNLGSLSTDDLISILLKAKNWEYRGLAAQALQSRKEIKVPDALIESMKSEPQLEVLRESIASFARVTGYPKNDVFLTEPIYSWWKGNKILVEAGLK